MSRYIGVTVLCDYVLSEGVEAVLANLHRVGAAAVAVNPTVTTEAQEGEEGASWQPPSDGGTSPRLFDRPLFGKRSLWVRSGNSFAARQELYEGCPCALATPPHPHSRGAGGRQAQGVYNMIKLLLLA